MNKSTIVFAALALLAASCTKTELVTGDAQSAQRGIGFSAYTAKPTKTAQTNVTTDNFNSFEVTAIGNDAIYFDDETFAKSNGVWVSDPVYFWPAYSLDFYAYNTPAHGTFNRSIAVGSQTLTFTPSTTLAEQEDLVAAKAIDTRETVAATPLTFKHYLTQLIVKAKCSNATYSVVVDSVKVTNLAGAGTYSFSNETMTATAGLANSASSTDYGSKFTAKPLSTTATEVMTDGQNGKWYLVPQNNLIAWDQKNDKKNERNGAYLALKVKITANNGTLKIYPISGENSAWMAVPVPESLTFAQGKKYIVTFDFFSATGGGAGYVDPENPGELDRDPNTDDNGKSIIGGAIKFSATVNPWTNVNEITIDL